MSRSLNWSGDRSLRRDYAFIGLLGVVALGFIGYGLFGLLTPSSSCALVAHPERVAFGRSA